MTQNTSKLMVGLVVVVILLSVFFTWNALTSPNFGPHKDSASNAQATVANSVQATPVLVTSGQASIDIQPKQTKEGA